MYAFLFAHAHTNACAYLNYIHEKVKKNLRKIP